MIRCLQGTVFSTFPETIIMTGGGVGYFVTCPKRTVMLAGETITLHTHLAVRETALDLYGFLQPEDLVMFELLLTISGVGPKSAMDIMDKADRLLITEAISNNDPEHLVKMAGIGKKTAEKIVLGLKDKIDSLSFTVEVAPRGNSYQDAFDTLVALGYNAQQVRVTLESLDTNNSTTTLVKEAMRLL